MATPMNIENVTEAAEERMTNALKALSRDFSGIRTGKASPAMVEGLMVDYYGTSTRLKDMASISCPEPRLISIQPWDTNALAGIEKAIINSDLGITPMNDGRLIRLPIPELSEERRKQMVKLVSQRAEEGKVEIRNVRRDANDLLKKSEKNSEITEDDLRDMTGDIQKLTDDFIKKISDAQAAKENDLMKI